MIQENIILPKGMKFKVKGTRFLGLTPRGRIMEVPFTQTVSREGTNIYFAVILRHIRGPLKGVEIRFNKTKLFQHSVPNICKCKAYNYPHSKGAGRCKAKKTL